MRQRCRRRLAETGLRAVDLHELCAEFGSRRARPVVLSSMTMPSNNIHAMLVRASEADYIVYERDTTPLHQQHLIAHELGHLIWDHRGLTGLSGGHADYDPVEELEAETTATLLLERQHRTLAGLARSERTRTMGQALGFEFGRW
ncbi:ImmA/IrrE family metallo-endopeptidase [Nocardia sp. SSK8]|uniref:ImmA/IrrE family metallo-endopeptidase n=1 Tax=Nocardia sp. SSK8 TaxID=3120154 RepID=UPI00300AAEA3